MLSISSFWFSFSFEDIFAPLFDIPILFLQFFQYLCCQQNPTETIKNENERVSGPLLAFSYAGMLWSYYLGTVAFLRDHFDLYKSNICLSGISAGCSSVMVIFLDLTIEQGFEFGLEWNRLFDSRFLKFFCLSTKQTLNMILNKFKLFGVDDKLLMEKYEKYGKNNLYFGVSAFYLSKCKIFHLLLDDFTNLKETIYAALCSMRILPFFRSVGFWRGYYCVDGAITSNYSIPARYQSDENKGKIIKIGVLKDTLVESDIAPSNNFGLTEFIISGDLKDNLIRFNKGYKDASKFTNIIGNYIKKGLIWNHSQIDYTKFNDINYEKEWDDHIENKLKQWNSNIIAHIKDCEDKQR